MCTIVGIPIGVVCIHGWEVMAPLKDAHVVYTIGVQRSYPWLGGHGSIEGWTSCRICGATGSCIHGWEVMAPLKADHFDCDAEVAALVSMAGKSWLH